MPTPLRIVYIMGYGRSGSTLLDTLLGERPGVLSTGELSAFPNAIRDPESFCACGAPVPDCPFWSAVARAWTDAGWVSAEYSALQGRLNRSWTSLLGARARTRWNAMTSDLFRALAEVSGASTIVDSSKLPRRGRLLAALPGFEVFLLHLVRDGRGVAWSLSRGHARDPRAGVRDELPPRSVLRTALRWTAVNVASNHVRRAHPPERQCVLRYEDYASAPEATLEPVLEFLRSESTEAEVAPRERHTLAGNRLRMKPITEVRVDREWESAMPVQDRRRFWRVAGSVMRSFGYSK